MTQSDHPRSPAATGSEGVTEIVADALELKGQILGRFLDRACGDDSALRAEVESLLAENEATRTDGFLRAGVRQTVPATEITIELTPAIAGSATTIEDLQHSPHTFVRPTRRPFSTVRG